MIDTGQKFFYSTITHDPDFEVEVKDLELKC